MGIYSVDCNSEKTSVQMVAIVTLLVRIILIVNTQAEFKPNLLIPNLFTCGRNRDKVLLGPRKDTSLSLVEGVWASYLSS